MKIFLGLALLYLAIVLCVPSSSIFAAETSGNANQTSTEKSGNPSKGSSEVSGNPNRSGESTTLINPLGEGNNSIPALLGKVIDVILVFAIPIIVLYIMYAGFLFVTARGDTSQISTAKSALLWAIVGGLIVLGAKVILEIMQGTLKDIL